MPSDPTLPLITVTRPLLPSPGLVQAKVEAIWEKKWLTNMGAEHKELETRLAAFLGVPFVSPFTNGTNALLTALKLFDFASGSEVIVTPFTFPGTPHVIDAAGLVPVFCDIDPVTLTLDPHRAESLITPQTCAILGVHVYGIPCDVAGIGALAKAHNLKVIYDGAHAFGTRLNGTPIGMFGDMTMLSFHATKLFHTLEGGALMSPHAELERAIYLWRNFGIADEETVLLPGLNGKTDEVRSAIGLLVLDMVEAEWACRQNILETYTAELAGIPGISLLPMPEGATHSYQYFPIKVGKGAACTRDELYVRFREANIHARKYFYPLCSQATHYEHLPSAQPETLPVATQAAQEVLCLPFYGALTETDIGRVLAVMNTLR